jgi:hypothetical protein
MFNQVPDQPFWVGVEFLVGWVTNPSTIDNGAFGVRRDPNELSSHNNGGRCGYFPEGDGGLSVTGTRYAIAVITEI